MDMDMWKYFGITHTDHTVMNPMSLDKTEELVDRLCLPESGRVLDVACENAEFFCLVAERYEVAGTWSPQRAGAGSGSALPGPLAVAGTVGGDGWRGGRGRGRGLSESLSPSPSESESESDS